MGKNPFMMSTFARKQSDEYSNLANCSWGKEKLPFLEGCPQLKGVLRERGSTELKKLNSACVCVCLLCDL